MALTHLSELEPITCCRCGILFAVPEEWIESRSRDYRRFFCPNGHGQSYVKPDEKPTIEKDVEARRELVRALHDAEQAEARAADAAARREQAPPAEDGPADDAEEPVDPLKRQFECPKCKKRYKLAACLATICATYTN